MSRSRYVLGQATWEEPDRGVQPAGTIPSGSALRLQSLIGASFDSPGKWVVGREITDAHLELYRTKHPQIAQIGPGPKPIWVQGTHVTSSMSASILLNLGCSECAMVTSFGGENIRV